MAHASTNSTWADYPSTATLMNAARFEALESTRDSLYTSEYSDLTRTRPALFKAYLASNSAQASGDAWITTGWTVAVDTESAWDPAAAGAATYTIPYGARVWDLYFALRTNVLASGRTLAAKVTANAANIFTSSIASEARPSIGTGGEGNCVLWRPNVALAAGDVLRFATFCSVAYTLGPIWGGVVPELIVRDAGPA